MAWFKYNDCMQVKAFIGFLCDLKLCRRVLADCVHLLLNNLSRPWVLIKHGCLVRISLFLKAPNLLTFYTILLFV